MVAGADACRDGWVVVLLDEPGARAVVRVEVAGDFASLLERIGPVEAIGVDIPIGLPQAGFRELDLEARTRAGARGRSVFITPPRAALEAEGHAEAVEIARRLTGQGISRQTYGLREKIFQVEACLETAPAGVFEVHPELSFAAMKGSPAEWPKRSWNGMMERCRLLEREGIHLAAELPRIGTAAADDVLDAAAAAWSARRIATGRHHTVPERPERIGGRPVAIHV